MATLAVVRAIAEYLRRKHTSSLHRSELASLEKVPVTSIESAAASIALRAASVDLPEANVEVVRRNDPYVVATATKSLSEHSDLESFQAT